MVTPILPLCLTGASVRKGGHSIIGPIDLDLGGKGVTLVIGPNGSGKTTLLRLIHGLERLADGTAAWQVPQAEALKRQAFIFQQPILMRRSVLDNVAYPLRLRGTTAAKARQHAADWAEKNRHFPPARPPCPVAVGRRKTKTRHGTRHDCSP